MSEHIRADEGLERPRQTALPPLRTAAAIEANRKLPADLDLEPILQRIADGTLVTTIAKELGVTSQRLGQILLKHPDYAYAKESGHEARLDEAEEWIETTTDALSLARARDVWRARSWRASVEVPRRWGQQRDISQAPPVQININLGRGVSVQPQKLPVAAPHLLQSNDDDGSQVIDNT